MTRLSMFISGRYELREGMINTGQTLRKSVEMKGGIGGMTNLKGAKDISDRQGLK